VVEGKGQRSDIDAERRIRGKDGKKVLDSLLLILIEMDFGEQVRSAWSREVR